MSVTATMTELPRPAQITIDDERHQFYWWGRATGKVAGGALALQGDRPESGYYRGQSKNRQSGESVSYAALYYYQGRLRQEGDLVALRNGEPWEESKALYAWPFVSARPVSREAYETFLKDGTWPGESAVVTASLSNEAPDENSKAGIMAQIDALSAEAKRLLAKGAAKTQAEADIASDISKRILALHTKAGKLRKAQSQPHWDEWKRINGEWDDVIGAAAIYIRINREVTDPWLKIEEERKQKEHNEAVVRHALAVAQAQTAAPGTEAVPLAAAPVYVPPTAGTRGRKTHLRHETIGVIEDFEKAAAAVRVNYPQDFLAFVQEKVTMAARAGIALDGCKIDKAGKAV